MGRFTEWVNANRKAPGHGWVIYRLLDRGTAKSWKLVELCKFKELFNEYKNQFVWVMIYRESDDTGWYWNQDCQWVKSEGVKRRFKNVKPKDNSSEVFG